jgi:sulfite exporter TauE/SafE
MAFSVKRLKLFFALSRTPHGLLDMATPAFGALLWLGAFPPPHIIFLGLITTFAGYTSVYALNDVIDFKSDREKVKKGRLNGSGNDLDAVLVRHPMAQGLLSFREGLLWSIAWGLWAMIGYLSKLNIFREGFYPKGMISKGFGRLRAIQSPFIYYPIGLLLGFLPCGSIYTALLIAARAGMETNSPWEGFFMGVGLMFFFGLGTVPALFLVAKLADLSWLKARDIIYKIGSIFMVLTGIYFVIRGIRF